MSNLDCVCEYHRYHVVHIVEGKDKVFDHSQSTWDNELRHIDRDRISTFPSHLYYHGMNASQLLAAVKEAGLID